MLTKRLVLTFQTSTGGRFRLTVLEPRDTVTAAEIQAAMNTVIAKNIFAATDGTPSAILGAQVVSRDSTEMIV